jgi:hypothetical protein
MMMMANGEWGVANGGRQVTRRAFRHSPFAIRYSQA